MTKYFIILAVIVWILTSSCTVAFFDEESYRSFAYTKPEVSACIKGFTNLTYDTNQFNYLNLRMVQMYEYEKGKKDNIETTKQMEITYSIFTNYMYLREYQTNGWSPAITSIRAKIIESAFDILMKTEQLKTRR